MKQRISSVDIVRGIIIVLMTLDHVRNFFHKGIPTDIDTTTPLLFFTRFITHLCATGFIFLAGVSIYLYSKRYQHSLTQYLLTRGTFLILLEILVVNFAWSFDIYFHSLYLGVLWVIGLSFIFLAFLVHIPRKLLLGLSIIMIAGHNLLDGVNILHESIFGIGWSILHSPTGISFGNSNIIFAYSLIPWLGVMTLGYCFGYFYGKSASEIKRKKMFTWLAVMCLSLFVILRYMNVYGDPFPWENQENLSYTLISFFNLTKYPPSLHYILLTLGGIFLLLVGGERYKSYRILYPFEVFGKSALFYYILHIFFIHTLALLFLSSSQGLALVWVYFIWIGTVCVLFPVSFFYLRYKKYRNNL